MKEVKPPQVPEDLNSAIKSGKVRAPTHIISTISDDRGSIFITWLQIVNFLWVGYNCKLIFI